MKNLQVLLALAIFVCLSRGASFGGYSNITILSNDDPGACRLTLSISLAPDVITFTENVYNPNWDCTYQNLQFAPLFRSTQIGGNITLSPSGTSTYTGTLNWAQLVSNNGTYCGSLGDLGNGDDFWACRFKYGSIFLQVAIFVNRTSGKFDTTWTDVLDPHYGTTNVNTANGQNLLTPNNSFPQLVARLPNGYTSWSTVVTDLLQPIYVTGTVLLSNQVNLTNYFSNFTLQAIGLKKPDGSYVLYKPNIVFYPFTANKQGPNNTTHIGLIWSQVLPDLNTCVAGCDVTFYLQASPTQVYLLQSSGITSQPKLLRA